ncbi:MAG: hypothetical protein HGA85_07435 [Nanoarchaeota archaeon]|nr:hypothetical protein [Nanoarchaeota archaeon]
MQPKYTIARFIPEPMLCTPCGAPMQPPFTTCPSCGVNYSTSQTDLQFAKPLDRESDFYDPVMEMFIFSRLSVLSADKRVLQANEGKPLDMRVYEHAYKDTNVLEIYLKQGKDFIEVGELKYDDRWGPSYTILGGSPYHNGKIGIYVTWKEELKTRDRLYKISQYNHFVDGFRYERDTEGFLEDENFLAVMMKMLGPFEDAVKPKPVEVPLWMRLFPGLAKKVPA